MDRWTLLNHMTGDLMVALARASMWLYYLRHEVGMKLDPHYANESLIAGAMDIQRYEVL